MNRLTLKALTIVSLLLAATAAFADDVPAPPLPAKAEKYIEDMLPVCSGEMKKERVGFQHALPPNLTGTVIRLQSDRATCSGQYITIVSKDGSFFAGIPIFLDGSEGTTFEERIKDYGWKNGQQNFAGEVDRSKPHGGWFDAKIIQLTDAGKLPIEGQVDADGKLFLFGHFMPLTTSYPEERLKSLARGMASAPTTGAAAPKVTVIEFSDFECPSCKNAAHYLKPIMEKYGDKVKYVRYDLPLVMAHPWAFSAAVAGRAIFRQKPEAFWDYKEQIYSNQDKITNFTIDDFARGVAQDHELDMKKYDEDLASAQIREELLNGVGIAYGNNILATPTYVVNGRVIDPGPEGKALESYVAGLLKK